MKTHLDFEQPLVDLQAKLDALTKTSLPSGVDMDFQGESDQIRAKIEETRKSIYSNLTPWQRVQLARHPRRPYTLDYLHSTFDDFSELHGDRLYSDDKAMVTGFAKLGDTRVMVMGTQKGRDTRENVMRNFGSAHPEGYRKALRLMEMAERFKMPVLTLIDTPGAYPGIDSEERGISEAIAQNLAVMSRLKTPIICTVIGEGSSGGALAIGVGDYLNMLQYATYFVISPEGCANIIWKTSAKAPDAAEAMGVTSSVLQELGIIDETIPEPMGGAHRDIEAMANTLRERLSLQVDQLLETPIDILLEKRYERLMGYGNS